MDQLHIQDLNELLNHKENYCITILLPTQKSGKEKRQDPIRLKNLYNKAREELRELGYEDTEEILRPVSALIDDSAFWNLNGGNGLAFFLSPKVVKKFVLPIEFDEFVLVNNRFEIKQLLPYFQNNGEFYVLALSKKFVRLYKCNHYECNELLTDVLPKDIDDALGKEIVNTTLQSHSTVNQGRRDAANQFHGQGSVKDQDQDRIWRYFNKIDKIIHRELRTSQAPLVIAAVDNYVPIFKDVSEYKNILDESVSGDPEQSVSNDLHAKAWNVVEPIFMKRVKEEIERYKSISGTRQVLDDVELIIKAAYEGRVDTLFVSTKTQVWGKFDRSNAHVSLHLEKKPDDEDLLNIATIFTLRNEGKVIPLKQEKLPNDVPIAGILRF